MGSGLGIGLAIGLGILGILGVGLWLLVCGLVSLTLTGRPEIPGGLAHRPGDGLADCLPDDITGGHRPAPALVEPLGPPEVRPKIKPPDATPPEGPTTEDRKLAQVELEVRRLEAQAALAAAREREREEERAAAAKKAAEVEARRKEAQAGEVLKVARALEGRGFPGEARRRYREVVERWPTTTSAAEARRHLARLAE